MRGTEFLLHLIHAAYIPIPYIHQIEALVCHYGSVGLIKSRHAYTHVSCRRSRVVYNSCRHPIFPSHTAGT